MLARCSGLLEPGGSGRKSSSASFLEAREC